jgi:hypothetical protein
VKTGLTLERCHKRGFWFTGDALGGARVEAVRHIVPDALTTHDADPWVPRAWLPLRPDTPDRWRKPSATARLLARFPRGTQHWWDLKPGVPTVQMGERLNAGGDAHDGHASAERGLSRWEVEENAGRLRKVNRSPEVLGTMRYLVLGSCRFIPSADPSRSASSEAVASAVA